MRQKYDQGEDPLDPEAQQGGGHPFRHGGQQFHFHGGNPFGGGQFKFHFNWSPCSGIHSDSFPYPSFCYHYLIGSRIKSKEHRENYNYNI